jgi:hypothetical protein
MPLFIQYRQISFIVCQKFLRKQKQKHCCCSSLLCYAYFFKIRYCIFIIHSLPPSLYLLVLLVLFIYLFILPLIFSCPFSFPYILILFSPSYTSIFLSFFFFLPYIALSFLLFLFIYFSLHSSLFLVYLFIYLFMYLYVIYLFMLLLGSKFPNYKADHYLVLKNRNACICTSLTTHAVAAVPLRTGINLLSFWGLHFQRCWILYLWSASDETAQQTTKLQRHVIQMTRSTTCIAFALCSHDIRFLCLYWILLTSIVFVGNISVNSLYNMTEQKLRVTRLCGFTASKLDSDFDSKKVSGFNKFPLSIPPWYIFQYIGCDFKQINV